MSLAQSAIDELTLAHQRFLRSTNNLTEEHSSFAPAGGMMTVAQQVAHVARVIDWFLQGAFRPEGFDMDFEPQIRQVMAVHSLTTAREWLAHSVASARAILSAQSDHDLLIPLPQGPVLGGSPRQAIVREMTDHTAHHRGVLTAYSRALGITPPDPYGM